MVQDAAYESLLKSRRQQLHARIAQVLEQAGPPTIEVRPELLAHHFTQAGLAEKAIEYWRRAGQQAVARSATAEAITQLRNGLSLLGGVPDSRERALLELDLQTTLGGALISAKGFAAPETGKAFARARQLCRQLGAAQELFPVMHGEFVYYLNCGEFQAADHVAREFLHLAGQQSDPAPILVGHRVVGVNEFFLGRFASARMHSEQVIAQYDLRIYGELAAFYVYDPCVASSSVLSLSNYALGRPEEARLWCGRSLAKAEGLGHPGSCAYALFFACLLNQLLRDSRALEGHASAMIRLADDQGFPFWLGHALLFHGWALAQEGQTDEGIMEMRRGVTIYQSTSARLWLPYVSARLAEMLARSGDRAQAAALCTQAIAQMEAWGERCFEAELRRLRGSLWLADGQPEEAKAALKRAIEVARRQQATSLELRAALDLGRILRDEGRLAEAQELVGAIRGRLSEDGRRGERR